MTKEQRRSGRIKTAQHMAAGMIIVAVLGLCVATGILITTKSGKEIRKKIKDKAIDAAKDVKNIVIKSADKIEVSAACLEDKVNTSYDAAQRKAEGIKKDFSEGSGRITKDIQETAENMARDLRNNT